MANQNLKPALCLIVALLLHGCALPGRDSDTIMIGNVTVIDPESRRVLEGRDVHIVDGRIATIRHTGADNHERPGYIDAEGKFLIPGLMDMHVHLAHPMFSDSTLELLLANGVTSVREMSGDCWEPRGEIFACIDDYRELQAEIEAGLRPGPHIERLSSAIVRGPSERRPPHVPEGAPDFVTPTDAAQATTLVGHIRARDVDFIKTYSGLPRGAYFALLEEAKAAGHEVSGHVPHPVLVLEASERGHRTIEHARVIPRDCSRTGSELRSMWQRRLAGDVDVEMPEVAEQLNAIVTSFDPALCRRLLAELVDNGTYYVPTHETREMDARAGNADYREDPRLAYVPTMLRGFWQQDLQSTANSSSAEDVAAYAAFFEHGLMITRLAFQSGVQIMAGTDANDTISFPGFSLHDELLHLSRAGLPPMDVLRAATTTPAAYLDQSDLLGGIAVGKRADLLLLDANPLENISNTRSIDSVIFNGKLLNRVTLDDLLDAARSRADNHPAGNS
ncbi:amidohydrolase family protein [Wenzhouxiangella sediminis]|uniref:Amidohydrolase-related domain-containing protein n=1 Tax=Wenzhouxiangella sediminis TaxID=1792836 RepID=A0A3E1K641_9GAMM|nr:amidohydrolase family protein [Wenzhouxiangella sediminis]RFF29497.1 hypothetical protein DZC52_12710 [Wenzhouxiangella sediminis]